MRDPKIDEVWEKIEEEVRNLNEKYGTPVKIAIVGFGKSGKSTLFNAIFGEDLQRVGAQTDLTQENREEKRFGTIFTDTRGFGTKLVSLEEIKMALEGQNLIIHCFNGMSAISDKDVELYNFCRDMKKPIIVVVTKVDVMKKREIEEYRESFHQKVDPLLDPIFLSAETGINMELLIHRIVELLPEAVKDAFIANQKRDLQIKQKKARKIIHTTAVAAVGFAVSPIPVSDVIVLIPLQAKMVVSIGFIYGHKISVERAKEILAVAGGGIMFRYAAQSLVKFLPGLGSIIGPSIAYAGTVAIGEAALAYFESGMKLSEKEISDIYKRAKQKAEKDYGHQNLNDAKLM